MVLYALNEEHADRYEGLPESDRNKENYNKYNNGFLAHKEILGVHVLFLGVPIKQVS